MTDDYDTKRQDTAVDELKSDSTSITPVRVKPDRLHADAYQHFQTTGLSFGTAMAKTSTVWNNLYSSKAENMKNMFSKRSQSIGSNVIHQTPLSLKDGLQR